jgi:hypothetical protein
MDWEGRQVSASLVGVVGRVRPVVSPWWTVPLGIAFVSRLFSLAWLLLGISIAPQHHQPGNGLIVLDAWWYTEIAQNGYHAQGMLEGGFGMYHDFAFFPGWPALIAMLSRVLPLDTGLVALLAANALFCVGAVLVWRFARPRFGERTANWGLALLAFSPAGYVFSMAYAESLFLVVAALALATPIASRSRAGLAALAQVIRLPGFAISATALVTLRAQPRRSLLVLISAPLVFAAWWLFIAYLTGDPLGYMQGTPSWWRIMGAPTGLFSWQPLAQDAIARSDWDDLGSPIAVICLLAILVGAGLFMLLQRERRDLGIYCLTLIAPTLLLAHWEHWPRHSVLAFPAFMLLAERLPHNPRLVLLVAFAVVQAVFVLQVTHLMMTP